MGKPESQEAVSALPEGLSEQSWSVWINYEEELVGWRSQI